MAGELTREHQGLLPVNIEIEQGTLQTQVQTSRKPVHLAGGNGDQHALLVAFAIVAVEHSGDGLRSFEGSSCSLCPETLS